MPLTLIKEDGTGKPDANSYAAVADGNAYHDGHLYASVWTGASTTTKEAALVMATRLIDAHYQFRGFKAHEAQALQWPRDYARDDDALRLSSFAGLFGIWQRDEYFAVNAVPKAVVDATCETARELIKADRTEDPAGEGLATFALTGTLSITFDKSDRPPVIPQVARAMLGKVGELIGAASGMVRLVRT